MRRIEFIAPVESMRGNLSGSQKLVYPSHNNSAWDAPDGKSAARNYTARYIGNQRFNGAKGFSVRTKHVINNTGKTKKAQALLAGSALCYLAANKTLTLISTLQMAYDVAHTADPSLTYRKWLMDKFYSMLENKTRTLTVTSPSTSVTINNPWVMGGTGTDLQIAEADYVKFWGWLSVNGTYFTMLKPDGTKLTGIATIGMTFIDLIDEPKLNILGLSADTIGSDTYVRRAEYLVKFEDAFVKTTENIMFTRPYELTTDTPE